MRKYSSIIFALATILSFSLCGSAQETNSFASFTLDYETPVDAALQKKLEAIDFRLRAQYGMTAEQTSVGVLDLKSLRLAMIRPDYEEYAASVAKIGILLAYFELHREAAARIDPQTRHELGLMVRPSSNEMAAKYSRLLGLKQIQQVLNSYHFYDTNHGGGIWVGRHYGGGNERYGDPIGDNSHAATVRQVLRYFLMLEQGKLVSAQASKTMREIFATPDIPHDNIKFVEALAGRDLQIIRKWGTWENWFHDSAVITGPDRKYILVALTHHPKGDDYLVGLAKAVDDVISGNVSKDSVAPRLRRTKADKILFLGNSITRHGPLASIGWTNDWGMAATAPEKDYVHLLTDSIAKLSGHKPEARIENLGDFERHYETFDMASSLRADVEFGADIVVVALGENVPLLTTDEAKAKFKASFVKLLKAVKTPQNALFVRSCFWPEPVRDPILKQACAEAGGEFVDISGLSANESNRAGSERHIAHAGVAAHPGDTGMKAIADALTQAILKYDQQQK